jgi:hypothetical protein
MKNILSVNTPCVLASLLNWKVVGYLAFHNFDPYLRNIKSIRVEITNEVRCYD